MPKGKSLTLRTPKGRKLKARLVEQKQRGPVSVHKTVESYARRDKGSCSSADAKVVAWLHDVLLLLAAGQFPGDGLHSF